jgi:hypothetical protein
MIKFIIPALSAGLLIGCGGLNEGEVGDTKPSSQQDQVIVATDEGEESSGGNSMDSEHVIQPAETPPVATTSSTGPAGGTPPVAPTKPLGAPIHARPPPAAPTHTTPPVAQTRPPSGAAAEPLDDDTLEQLSGTANEELPFTDEFYDGEPGHLRQVPPPPPTPTVPDDNTLVGEIVARLVVPDISVTVNDVLDQLIMLLYTYLSPDRNTGLFVARPPNHMEFWVRSKGPELLEFVNNHRDCGVNVVDENSPKTKCYLAMMIGTHVPVPEGFKPREVSRQIGLFDFCEQHKDGIARELQLRAKDPSPYDGWRSDNLPNYFLSDEEVATRSVNDAFAANWLSFCPNLVEATEPGTRLMVFKHAVYRMQIASLHTNGQNDNRYNNINVVRETAFVDIVDTLLMTDRVQLLRRPISQIRFAGAEARALGRGVKEDWANEVGKQIFKYSMSTRPEGADRDPNRELFSCPDNNEYVFLKEGALEAAQTRSAAGREIVEKYYKAAGRFVGWMLINGYPIPEDLSLMFYAKLMGRKIGWEAIKIYDRQNFRLFRNCLQTPNGDCPYIGRYAIHYRTDEEELLVNPWPSDVQGRKNVLDDAVTNMVTALAEEEQYRIFSQGIYDVIPQHIFECGITTKDLRLLLVGELTIDADDLVNNLSFQDYSREDDQIRWLSTFLRGLNQNQLQAFLEFVSGRRRPGFGGFAPNPIDIKRMSPHELRDPRNPVEPPKAHVCFRQLELPSYANEATLRDKMTYTLGPAAFGML